MFRFLDVQTLKGVEDAGEEEDKGGEGSNVQEGQTPRRPKEAAEAPDAEKGHAVLLPLVSGADLPVNHAEHHEAGAEEKTQQRHVGAVVSQHGLRGALHPAPAHSKHARAGKANNQQNIMTSELIDSLNFKFYIWDFVAFPRYETNEGLFLLYICPYLKVKCVNELKLLKFSSNFSLE